MEVFNALLKRASSTATRAPAGRTVTPSPSMLNRCTRNGASPMRHTISAIDSLIHPSTFSSPSLHLICQTRSPATPPPVPGARAAPCRLQPLGRIRNLLVFIKKTKINTCVTIRLLVQQSKNVCVIVMLDVAHFYMFMWAQTQPCSFEVVY